MSETANSPERLTSALSDMPEVVRQWFDPTNRDGVTPSAATIDNIFQGKEFDTVRSELMTKGIATIREANGDERLVAANVAPDGRIMDMAAVVPRQAGNSLDFLNNIEDFKELLNANKQTRKDAIALFHKIARADGMSNNAINKLAALVAPEGSFKVRSVKGQRGKAGDKAAGEAERALNWWKDNVNARADETVISGDRGVIAFIVQGTRLQLIEGDHIARHLTPKGAIKIPGLTKAWSLPMNLQTFSAQHIDIPEGLQGTNYEILYWTPPASFIQLLQNNKDKNLQKALDQFVPKKVQSELLKNKTYFLDPALLIHIKHRATQVDTFGQSLLEPTLGEVRYKRALDALELTVVTNLMARMVIIKVGSDNEKSVYHRQEVSTSRLSLLQRMMRNVGPTATVLWAGPDIDVVEVSAHDALLDIVPRMKQSERRHLMALGLPAVLMVGEGNDGKAAGFAAAMGVAAQLAEIQYQYAQALKTLAERILIDNGFEEIDVVWEWHNNLLEDKQAAAELILKMFDRGLLSPETVLEETGFDYGAEETRQGEAVKKGYKEKPFEIPAKPMATGENPGGVGGQGRPDGTENPGNGTDPRKNKETKKSEENK